MVDCKIIGQIVTSQIRYYSGKENNKGTLTFSIRDNYKDKKGQWQTKYYNCVMFGVSEQFAGALKKADVIIAQAIPQLDEYKSKDGEKKVSLKYRILRLDIVSFKSKNDSKVESNSNKEEDSNKNWYKEDEDIDFEVDNQDDNNDIPF